MINSTNPLIKHFRQPQLYIKLPSQGKWYKPGSIDLPVTKELPVYAMTAKDEITAKTPDALMTGQSVVDIIHSCVPNIKNAWELPVIDLDQVLISIRRATYGNGMDFITVCPHCQKKNENVLNLELLLNANFVPNFEESITIDGLEYYIQPQTFRQFNNANIKKFEIQRVIALMMDNNIPEKDRIEQVQHALKDLLDLTAESVISSIVAIKTEDGVIVDHREHIAEFIKNCKKEVWETLRNKITAFNDDSPTKNLKLTCLQDDCKKDYSTPLIFDMANFFV